jgi:ribose transport system permease protein
VPAEAPTPQSAQEQTNTVEQQPKAPTASAQAADAGLRKSAASRFFEKYVVIFALIAVVIVFSITRSATFPTASNIESLLTTQSVLLIVSLTLTVLLASGELDLSIGGGIGFSSVFAADLMVNHAVAWPLALLFALLAALLIGAINSFFVVKVRMNPFITTLAMGTVLDGAASAVSSSATIGNLPTGFTDIFQKQFLNIGLPFWFGIVVLILMVFVMHQMPVGRRLWFTGEGRESARLMGIRVNRIRVAAFFISAIGAWAAGIILVGQTGAAQAGNGDAYTLPAYAAAFLGAATIRPGRFNPMGTFIGVLLTAVGNDGLQLFGLATWVTQVFDGGILIVAVAAAVLLGRARARD